MAPVAPTRLRNFQSALIAPRPTSAKRHPAAVSARFTMATSDPNSAGCKRHDGRTSDSGCAGFRRDSREAKEFVPPIHDLTKLVTKAKLRINKADRETLGELTSFSVWRGKYPTPLSATAYTPAVLDASIGRERLWKRYDALYRKLHRLAVRKSFPEAIRAPRRAQARR